MMVEYAPAFVALTWVLWVVFPWAVFLGALFIFRRFLEVIRGG